MQKINIKKHKKGGLNATFFNLKIFSKFQIKILFLLDFYHKQEYNGKGYMSSPPNCNKKDVDNRGRM